MAAKKPKKTEKKLTSKASGKTVEKKKSVSVKKTDSFKTVRLPKKTRGEQNLQKPKSLGQIHRLLRQSPKRFRS
jgi:hypothetical protein